MSKQKPFLIIGGTGKTGGRVVQLLKEGGHEYRLGTPDSEIPFDWYKSETWDAALEGVSGVYVVFYPDLAVPGAPEIVQDFVDHAKKAKVEHLVLLSGRGEEAAHHSEQIVMDSGLPWTVVRSSWFMQNFSENFFLDDILRREVAFPVPTDIAEPFADADDIAEVVFSALTDPKHRGQLYEITGADLLTFEQAIEHISKAIGKPIAYIKVSYEDYEGAMRAIGLPEGTVNLMHYLFTEVLDGRNAKLTDGVERALGRQPGTFDAYVARTAKTGVWG